MTRESTAIKKENELLNVCGVYSWDEVGDRRYRARREYLVGEIAKLTGKA